ncbi:ankyrin repeat domain-containing protein [Maribacter sp. 2308TA10-17]|uniref:ankyrin repeat domain-containing protein n=1 Tax=Maribacter sp. 2308TA10-17 TaxID=3386276 RepID=UPI0039BD8718
MAFWEVVDENETKNVFQNFEHTDTKKTFFEPAQLKRLQDEMMQACRAGEVETVENLLQKQLSPNFIGLGGSPLAIAVSFSDKNLIDCLLHYGADINFNDSENLMAILPLMKACENENIVMIKYLIALDAEVNMVGGNGKSILEVAVNTGNTEVVKILLDSGAHTEIKSGFFMSFDKTPLTAAVSNNDTDMVSLLIKNGAKTKPLRKMIRHEIHPKMVKFLKTRKCL